MKKPSVPSRCGRRLQEAWHAPMLPQRHVGAQVVGARSRAVRPGTPSRRPRSRWARSCRWSRRACRPGAGRRAPGAQDRRLLAREPGRQVGRLAPARVGARRERAEVRARRVDEHAVVGVGLLRRRRRRRRGPRRRRPPPCARPCAASASARPGDGARRPRRPPSPPISAARWVVLPPGAAHRSSTRSPGRGASSRATVIAARDCGMKRPRAHSGEANASNGAVEHETFGQAGRRMGRHGQCGRELRRGRRAGC